MSFASSAQGPASLPSSYAFLSHFSGRLQPHDCVEEEGIYDAGRSPARPQFPAMGSYPRRSRSLGPTEATPLLTRQEPPVPSAEEQLDNEPMFSMVKKEMVILTNYSLPVFVSQLLEYSLVTVSVISIGHLSTTALAAISLGSMTASVTAFSVIQGLVGALDTVLPASWTSSDPSLVGLWTQRMTIIMAIALMPMYLVWFNAERLLILLKQDPEIAHFAALYLRWVSLGLPGYAFNCISRRYFQSQGLFTVPTHIISFVALVNVLLNYLLVWGPPPVRLGFIGAPLATAISFNLVSLASVIYGVFFIPRTAWHPPSTQMFSNLGMLARLGLSSVGQVASEWWAWELISLAAALLGPVSLATQSVLLVSSSTAFQIPFSLGIATSVRVGNLLGERRARRAEATSKTALLMALMVAIPTSALFVTFRNHWALMFNNDPDIVKLVAAILPIVALFQVFDATSAVNSGILRATGRQFTGALLNLSAYYILGIPLGVWLAFSWKMGLSGLWLGLTASLVYCAVFGTYLCLRTNWNAEVKKVLERVERDELKKREVRQCSE